MSKKFYHTKIVGIGGDVPKFLSVVKMLVMFDDSMVLPELREFSVLHSGNVLDGVIKPGDILKIADSEFKIIKVGSDVHTNLRTLGHVIVKFDGGAGELLDGSVHVEDKPIPQIRVGDEVSISEAGSDVLHGKKAAIVNADDDMNRALAQMLLDNGASIVGEDTADIVITVKDKPIPQIRVDDEVSISEAGSDVLHGKKAAIDNGASIVGEDTAEMLLDNDASIVGEDTEMLLDNGASIVEENTADIVVEENTADIVVGENTADSVK